ncbi:hypothetical protein IPA_01875 [Ignicoccus pacificus DSM 13166]|uniref:CRISPR-associated exonuclease Cas4 n=1 Tax=Ignicoccus pacificus DSM 13166 TaxID=940294 RepID=A0A977KAK3_9CREN|nr:hypothetical protein IPA_01875 [Ignicoccus pacificus DSM 13166]
MRVRPSELRTLAFCPRLLFFETHLAKEVTLKQKVRMLLGKIWHFFIEILMKEESEVRVLGRIGEFEVSGRADGVGEREIIEIKSGRGPRNGAWYGDYLQALTYAMVLKKEKVVIKYRDKVFEKEVDDDDGEELLNALNHLKLIKDGYLPPPKRSKWCSKCPYRELCEALGKEGDDWFWKIPWVKE